MHFCVFATRDQGALSVPRKYGLNWFMPALVNSRDGSSSGTVDELGTNVCPCRWVKNSMYCWRISFEVMSLWCEGLFTPRRGAASEGRDKSRPCTNAKGLLNLTTTSPAPPPR